MIARRRSTTFLTAVSIITSGLALRTYGYALGWPFIVVKYGGSALWAAMVYFLITSIASARPPRHIALAAFALAVSVEASRLVHTPGLDAFRMTPVGALVLGRFFSLWNLVAYGAGIALAAGFDLAITRASAVLGHRNLDT